MSFKFKLGEFVVPVLARQMGIPVGPSEVTAIQLDGYIQIHPIGTHRRCLVEAKDYEIYDEEVIKSGIEGDAFPAGWGIEEL